MPDNPLDNDPEGGDPNPWVPPGPKHGHRSAGRTFLAVAIVVAGLVAGGFIGFAVNFGACFKSECNAFEQGAVIYLPLASLLFTLPIAYAMTKRRD